MASGFQRDAVVAIIGIKTKLFRIKRYASFGIVSIDDQMIDMVHGYHDTLKVRFSPKIGQSFFGHGNHHIGKSCSIAGSGVRCVDFFVLSFLSC